jgi:hypothetical protein
MRLARRRAPAFAAGDFSTMISAQQLDSVPLSEISEA